MARKCTEIIKLLLACAYWTVRYARGGRPRRLILYYHAVTEGERPAFGWQMQYLSRHCTVVRLRDLMDAPVGRGRNIVAITFDDGFECVRTSAWPVLRENRFPAAVFVPLGYLGHMPEWNMAENCPDRNQRVMSEQDLVELSGHGIDILSHAVSHTPLTGLDGRRLDEELGLSKACLEKILGREVYALSYPHGAHNAAIARRVHAAGYQMAVTIEPHTVGIHDDLYALPRFEVSAGDSRLRFRMVVSGGYEVVSYLLRFKRFLSCLIRRPA